MCVIPRHVFRSQRTTCGVHSLFPDYWSRISLASVALCHPCYLAHELLGKSLSLLPISLEVLGLHMHTTASVFLWFQGLTFRSSACTPNALTWWAISLANFGILSKHGLNVKEYYKTYALFICRINVKKYYKIYTIVYTIWVTYKEEIVFGHWFFR